MSRNKWIMRFAWMHKGVFLCAFLIVTLMTLIDLIYPFLNGEIINIIFYDKDMASFLHLCIIYASILVFNQFGVATLNNLIQSQLMTEFLFDIRRTFFRTILHKRGIDLSKMYSGDMISRMNNDTEEFVRLLFASGIWGYSNFLHISIAVYFMFYYNLFLGLITIALVPTVVFSSRYFKKKSESINKTILKEQGNVSSFLFEVMKNLQEIKILNSCKNVLRIYLRKTTHINKMNVQSGKISVTAERVNAFISLVAQLIVFSVCTYLIVNNRMRLGFFVAAVNYFNMAVTYFNNINGKIVDIGKQNAAIQRVVDILNTDEENYKEDVIPYNIQNGLIEYRNVTFGYTEDKDILNGINLRIHSGSSVGIVGKSGEGKTTIASLLYQLYDIASGEILIDGVNIKDYNLHSLRRQIGVVHQETTLYYGTLRYNLLFSNNKDHDNQLLEALNRTALYDFYLRLPDGLDTILGVGVRELSGGEKQRLAIARVLVKDSKILIFDEATSSLDDCNEDIIRKLMKDIAKDRTLIVIAHRLSTIRSCDKIAVLVDGVINGFDTHEYLIRYNEAYINLFRNQRDSQ